MSNKYPGGFVSLGGPLSNSNYFNGAAYLSIANNTALDLGTGDYTIEGWWNFSDTSNQSLISKYSAFNGFVVQYQSGNLRMVLGTGGADLVYSFAWTPTVGTWYHIAITRSGTSGRAFVNGVQIGSTTTFTTSNSGTSTTLQIGLTHTVSEYTRGFASNVRVVKGTALYTANFAAPTGPLQNIANTTLLTCQSPTIIDNSSNAWTITNTSVTVSSNTPLNAYNPNNLDPALGAATPGVWTLSQALQAEVTRSWPMYDPYYKNVVLNLHGEGTNGAQNNTFLDSSSNNFTITRNGNTTQGSFSPYGNGWSNYFNGSNSWLEYNGSFLASYNADVTIECWFMLSGTPSGTAYNTSYYISGGGTLLNNTGFDLAIGNTAIWFNQADYTSRTLSGTWTPNFNWNHLAVTRSGNTWTMWLNGVSIATASSSTAFTSTIATTSIGRCEPTGGEASGYMNGYISNYRITKSCLYTSTFTPSTTPLTAIANCQIVTCQSNRFVDNSASPLTITPYGSPSVQRFQPFLFNTSYTPSTIGGSGYFDGSGDYLTVGAASNWTFLHNGSSDWTMQFWVYHTSTSLIGAVSTTAFTAETGMGVFLNNTGNGGAVNNVQVYITNSSGSYAAFNSSAVLVTNAWNYVAITFTSSTKTCAFTINGASAGSSSNTGFAYSSSAPTNTLAIGRYQGSSPGGYLIGYMGDVRISNTVRTSLTTVPTAPITSDANTNLLTNYTNGAIYDNAMMNDLETVGNAQISTSVKKYGTGSMYFDGTGDYLTSPFVASQNLGTGDFTIEMWAYFSSVTSVGLLAKGTNSGNAWQGYNVFVSSGTINFETNDTQSDSVTGVRLTASSTVTTGQWYHIAFVRQSGTTKMYLNGTSVGSASNSGSCDNSYGFRVGISRTGQDWTMNGYIDDLRITKGVARYVANFTPPTSQLQDQ